MIETNYDALHLLWLPDEVPCRPTTINADGYRRDWNPTSRLSILRIFARGGTQESRSFPAIAGFTTLNIAKAKTSGEDEQNLVPAILMICAESRDKVND